MLPKTGKKFPAGNDRDGGGMTYAGIVAGALVADLGETHRAAKILMSWTGAGERTVKHWLAGTHGPCGDYLLVLMRESETVFRAIVTAAGRRDPEAAARVRAVPGVMSDAVALGRIEQTAGPPSGETAARAWPNDRDDDRIRDRNDDRDRAGAGAPSGVSSGQRQIWFLEAVGAGRHVAAAEIMERWSVSEKTARRDIAVLKATGLVEFVGTRRSGRYRPVR